MHSGNLSQIAFTNIWLLVLTEITRATHITNIFITRIDITDTANNTSITETARITKNTNITEITHITGITHITDMTRITGITHINSGIQSFIHGRRTLFTYVMYVDMLYIMLCV